VFNLHGARSCPFQRLQRSRDVVVVDLGSDQVHCGVACCGTLLGGHRQPRGRATPFVARRSHIDSELLEPLADSLVVNVELVTEPR
jgi:hypothetical protein